MVFRSSQGLALLRKPMSPRRSYLRSLTSEIGIMIAYVNCLAQYQNIIILICENLGSR